MLSPSTLATEEFDALREITRLAWEAHSSTKTTTIFYLTCFCCLSYLTTTKPTTMARSCAAIIGSPTARKATQLMTNSSKKSARKSTAGRIPRNRNGTSVYPRLTRNDHGGGLRLHCQYITTRQLGFLSRAMPENPGDTTKTRSQPGIFDGFFLEQLSSRSSTKQLNVLVVSTVLDKTIRKEQSPRYERLSSTHWYCQRSRP